MKWIGWMAGFKAFLGFTQQGVFFPFSFLYLFLPSEWHKCSWNISKWRQCGPRCQILIMVADETEEEKEKRGGRERERVWELLRRNKHIHSMHCIFAPYQPPPPPPQKIKEGYVSKSLLCVCRCSGIPKKTNKSEGKNVSRASRQSPQCSRLNAPRRRRFVWNW